MIFAAESKMADEKELNEVRSALLKAADRLSEIQGTPKNKNGKCYVMNFSILHVEKTRKMSRFVKRCDSTKHVLPKIPKKNQTEIFNFYGKNKY